MRDVFQLYYHIRLVEKQLEEINKSFKDLRQAIGFYKERPSEALAKAVEDAMEKATTDTKELLNRLWQVQESSRPELAEIMRLKTSPDAQPEGKQWHIYTESDGRYLGWPRCTLCRSQPEALEDKPEELYGGAVTLHRLRCGHCGNVFECTKTHD